MWSLGSSIGPAIGGVLANPATRWPQIFGKLAFFQNYPYFLPCAAAGLLCFFAFGLSYIGLKESLNHEQSPSLLEESERSLLDGETQPDDYGAFSTPAAKTDNAIHSVRELLTGDLRIVLLNYGLLSFTDSSYFVLIPLIYSSPIPVGGLGLSPYQIGLILGIFALLNGFCNLLVLTPILKKIGPRKMYIVSYSTFLFVFSLLWILRDVAHLAERINALVWALLVCQLFFALFINTAFSSISLLIVKNAPPKALGAVNGMAQMTASGTRGFAPLIASSLFSVSLQSRVAGGHLVDIALIALSAMGLMCAFRIPENR